MRLAVGTLFVILIISGSHLVAGGFLDTLARIAKVGIEQANKVNDLVKDLKVGDPDSQRSNITSENVSFPYSNSSNFNTSYANITNYTAPETNSTWDNSTVTSNTTLNYTHLQNLSTYQNVSNFTDSSVSHNVTFTNHSNGGVWINGVYYLPANHSSTNVSSYDNSATNTNTTTWNNQTYNNYTNQSGHYNQSYDNQTYAHPYNNVSYYNNHSSHNNYTNSSGSWVNSTYYNFSQPSPSNWSNFTTYNNHSYGYINTTHYGSQNMSSNWTSMDNSTWSAPSYNNMSNYSNYTSYNNYSSPQNYTPYNNETNNTWMENNYQNNSFSTWNNSESKHIMPNHPSFARDPSHSMYKNYWNITLVEEETPASNTQQPTGLIAKGKEILRHFGKTQEDGVVKKKMRFGRKSRSSNLRSDKLLNNQ